MTIARRPIAERVISSVTALSTNHPATWTADPDTNVLTSSVAHGLTVNTPIAFGAGTGALPAGLAAEPEYYWVVAAPTTATLQVSLTFGGAAVDITDAGTAGWVVKMLPSANAFNTGPIDLAANPSIDIYLSWSLARNSTNNPYLAISVFPITTSRIFASFEPSNNYYVTMYGSSVTKKYSKTMVKISIRRLSSGLSTFEARHSGVCSGVANYASDKAFIDTAVAGVLTHQDTLDNIRLYDARMGYCLSGATIIVVAAAR